MFKRIAVILSLLSVLFAAACQAAPKSVADNQSRTYVQSESAAAPASAPAPMAPGEPAMDMATDGGERSATFAEPTLTAKDATGKRLVIMNTSLSIVVTDPGKKMDAVAKMATDMGGFVVTSSLHKITLESGVEVPQASITVRVPAEKLNDALDQIKAETVEVKNEQLDGQDVTKEYTDLQSRLRSRQDAEAQLKEIMASATKTEDVLNVFNQLTYVQQEIEVLKGQIKYYEESSALSAISVDIVAEESVQPVKIAGWQPAGVASDAVRALLNTLKFLANVAIWLVIFLLPLAIVIVLPIYLLVKLFRHWSARRKANKQIPPPPPQPK